MTCKASPAGVTVTDVTYAVALAVTRAVEVRLIGVTWATWILAVRSAVADPWVTVALKVLVTYADICRCDKGVNRLKLMRIH